MEPRQQRIMDAVEARMKTILAANGYQTDLGQSILIDRPQIVKPDGSIGSPPVDPLEMPCLLIRDLTDEISEESTGTHRHRLAIELEVQTQSSTGVSADKIARRMAADVLKAISIDTTWGGLADWTFFKVPAIEKISLQGDITFVAAIVRIVVEYETTAWQAE